MSAVTASIASANAQSGQSSGGGMFGGKLKEMMEKAKIRRTNEGKIKKHGDEAHTDGGAVGEEEVVPTEADPREQTPLPMKSTSPAKIANVGYDYEPFSMKASGAKYNNSPINKNYGSAEQRGFGTPTKLKAFGVDDYDGPDKVSTSPGKFGAAVGSSPVKGFFSAIKNIFKKKVDPVAAESQAMGEVGVGSSGGDGGGAVPTHGDESHGGGGGAGAEAMAVDGGGEEAPWEAMNRKDFKGMDRRARKDYMGGLDTGQRKQQMKAMNPFSSLGSFGGASGGGGGFGTIGNMFSDIHLKENIERTGVSESGIPIYEFNYINDNNRYSGAMAQDVLEINPDAVSIHESGYYKVNYNNIDVDMHLIN